MLSRLIARIQWASARVACHFIPRRYLITVIRRVLISELECLPKDVEYGPLKGLKFPSQSSWASRDRVSQAFGVYEQNVLRWIHKRGKYDRLICIGAADGYYGVGLVACGLAGHAFCFEAREEGQDVIQRVAALNGVSHAVDILGSADPGFLSEIPKFQYEQKRSLVLIDIEGGEFEILTHKNLEFLKGADIVVEVHPEFVAEGQRAVEALLKRCRQSHEVKIITTGRVSFPEDSRIAHLTDTERSILFDEERAGPGRWLVLSRKNASTS